ncbi:hypothetical protein A9K55_003629 [Cordyceps militaris]|uniref:Uncharacterized protein n=1 Tax=Cordyceps militaris TaxID=73501 RepID=A0A2H4S7J9_CORMI|nr:hypothetical protein A9K55_003629 [Cordyceps militaris]
MAITRAQLAAQKGHTSLVLKNQAPKIPSLTTKQERDLRAFKSKDGRHDSQNILDAIIRKYPVALRLADVARNGPSTQSVTVRIPPRSGLGNPLDLLL